MPRGINLDLSDGTKVCPGCKTKKTVDNFHKSKSTVTGYQVYCKPCTAAKHDAWRLQNLAHCAADQKRRRHANPERWADYGRKQNYGMSPGEYDRMLAEQEGKCAICSATEAGGKGNFHVDHCHNSKKVRGLLCHCCNLGIGYLKHSKTVLEAAVVYLAERGGEG